MQRKTMAVFLLGLVLMVAWLSGIACAEERGVIYGRLYISPAGDLSYDVMFGSEIEVRLLRDKGDLKEKLNVLKKDRIEQINAQDEVRKQALGEFRAAAFAYVKDDKRIQKTREALRQESEKLRTLRSEYKEAVDALFDAYTFQKVITDKEGNFRFEGLPIGHYFLHAQYEILRTTRRFVWLHPVELKADAYEQQADLTKPNSIDLYDGS